MDRPKPALLAVSLCLSSFFLGCGGSSSTSSGPLQVTTQSPLPSGRVNSAYSTTLTATGGVPPYSWTASNVPPGLVVSTVGTLSGTPTQNGSFTPTVSVSDSARGVATGNFSMTIAAPLQITTSSLPNSSPGMFYSATLAAMGGFTPYTWSITQGTLPAGLTLNATTGLISGTTMNTGMSNFTVQLSDGGTPPATATANLSITIYPPPVRSAALYDTDETGYQINSDGSLTLLPSFPEYAMNGYVVGSSSMLPLLFTVAAVGNPGLNGPPNVLESLLINPDYALTVYSSSAALPSTSEYGVPSVDPTGSNVYVSGYIDNGQTLGVLIYPANGSFELVGNIAIPNVNTFNARVAFTPDGTLAFVATSLNLGGSINSYSRASNGTLTLAVTYNLSAANPGTLTVSPDGRYLAASELNTSSPALVQVFSIATDGTLTAVNQPFTVTYDSQGTPVGISDMTWDSSGSFLLLATDYVYGFGNHRGGVAVLSFSGTSLSEIVYPMGFAVNSIQRAGSSVYAHEICRGIYCPTIDGFDFQNGQLTALPGSPWTSNPPSMGGNPGGMVVY